MTENWNSSERWCSVRSKGVEGGIGVPSDLERCRKYLVPLSTIHIHQWSWRSAPSGSWFFPPPMYPTICDHNWEASLFCSQSWWIRAWERNKGFIHSALWPGIIINYILVWPGGKGLDFLFQTAMRIKSEPLISYIIENSRPTGLVQVCRSRGEVATT